MCGKKILNNAPLPSSIFANQVNYQWKISPSFNKRPRKNSIEYFRSVVDWVHTVNFFRIFARKKVKCTSTVCRIYFYWMFSPRSTRQRSSPPRRCPPRPPRRPWGRRCGRGPCQGACRSRPCRTRRSGPVVGNKSMVNISDGSCSSIFIQMKTLINRRLSLNLEHWFCILRYYLDCKQRNMKILTLFLRKWFGGGLRGNIK